ncbi:hypothetical protein ACFYZ9_18200 [Streptomyces sp. NPDC001691]|uniref:hypothetical protein n=1 Tax=Streptomyces sp. NPDC001691 TaxID=3364600 RepID=UPI00369AC277
MPSFNLSSRHAWNVLVTVSQRPNSKVRLAAENVLDSISGDPLPQPLQEQPAAALAAFRTRPTDPLGKPGVRASAPNER